MDAWRSVPWQVDGRKDRVWIFKLVLITLNTERDRVSLSLSLSLSLACARPRNQITVVLKVSRYLDPLPSVSSALGDPFYRSFMAAVGHPLSPLDRLIVSLLCLRRVIVNFVLCTLSVKKVRL